MALSGAPAWSVREQQLSLNRVKSRIAIIPTLRFPALRRNQPCIYIYSRHFDGKQLNYARRNLRDANRKSRLNWAASIWKWGPGPLANQIGSEFSGQSEQVGRRGGERGGMRRGGREGLLWSQPCDWPQKNGWGFKWSLNYGASIFALAPGT